MPYNLDLNGAERYIDELDEQGRKAVDDAVRSTIHYMLGLRNGACYRYEREINIGVNAVLESNKRRRLKSFNRG